MITMNSQEIRQCKDGNVTVNYTGGAIPLRLRTDHPTLKTKAEYIAMHKSYLVPIETMTVDGDVITIHERRVF